MADRQHAQYGLTFSRRLTRSRHEKGWTQETLAQLSGVSRRHISLIERGQMPRVSIGTVAMIAGALAEPIDWLCGMTQRRRCSCTA